MTKEEKITPKGCGYRIAGVILGLLLLIYLQKSGEIDLWEQISNTFSKLNNTWCEMFSVIFS